MSDTISRQAAIEVIDAVMPVDPNKSEYASGIACGAALAMTYVKQLPSAQPEQRWIPCSERLPRPYEQVLRIVKSFGWNCTSHTHVDIGTICPIDTDVIAWMPLPEPYKGGDTE